jgi:hypothetical protein
MREPTDEDRRRAAAKGRVGRSGVTGAVLAGKKLPATAVSRLVGSTKNR